MGNSGEEGASSSSTILDALLKLITIDKLGVSLPKVSESEKEQVSIID